MKLFRLSTIAIFALLALHASAGAKPPNFGVVVEKNIYRGGQPTGTQFDDLEKLGVRTILKLNNHNMSEEKRAAKRLGMKLVTIPLEPSTIGTPPTCRDVARAMAVLRDESNWPVYVHCSRGRDRTGYLVGAFRQLAQHWPWERVDEELERYGHNSRLRSAYPAIAKELRNGTPSCSSELGPTGTPAP